MPANWSMVDNSFPTFTGEEKPREQTRMLADYMHILVEELKYQLANLDTTNWNGAALMGFQNDTTKDVKEQLTRLAAALNSLSGEMTAITARLAALDNLSQRMADAETDITWLEKDRAEAARLLEIHSAALAALQTDAAEFAQWADGVEEDIREHDRQIEGLLGGVDALEQRMDDVEEQLAYLDGRMLELELLTTQLHQEQTAHAAKLEKLEKMITASGSGGGSIGTEGQDLRLYGNVYINGKLVE